MRLPTKGSSRAELRAAFERLRAQDADWRNGRTFSLVYFAGEDVIEVLRDAVSAFVMENALSPLAFPSLKQMENDVLGIVADLLHGGDEAAGSLTTGGTESILMCMKTARDWGLARRPGSRPEVVLPITVHPAFEKASHYLGVKPVHIPTGPDHRADVAAARAAITEDTVMIVGSAPPYPHGAVDPIEELAALAKDNGLLMHVDACLGGLILPFVEKLGLPVPTWDFRVPGVTSISADLHKYGYAAKGASAIVYRDASLRKFQFFTYSEWPGGLYASPTMTGTRSGGAIAAAWAVLHYLGEEGYLRLARRIMDTSRRLIDGIAAIPGLRILGEPTASVFSFTADDLDIYAVGQAMEAIGWRLDFQQAPPSLHCMITPAHETYADDFLVALRKVTAEVRESGASASGTAAVYGMLAALPEREQVGDFLKGLLDGIYTREATS